MSTVVVDTAADEAERLVAEVRDDPAGRVRLAVEAYPRPYASAVVAFMRWQNARGVLAASPWWRAVNEGLLRDTWEARILMQRGGDASRRSVQHWIAFFEKPSAASFYLAHNASVVAGYLDHQDLAAAETPAERFFMNVVLARVLYAQALVTDRGLALGRLSFIGGLLGHPRARTAETLLGMRDVLPALYPIETPCIDDLIGLENPLGRLLDYAVIATRTEALYASAAHAIGDLRLLGLVRNGAPIYEWPYEMRHVWFRPVGQPGRLARLVGFLTRPQQVA